MTRVSPTVQGLLTRFFRARKESQDTTTRLAMSLGFAPEWEFREAVMQRSSGNWQHSCPHVMGRSLVRQKQRTYYRESNIGIRGPQTKRYKKFTGRINTQKEAAV